MDINSTHTSPLDGLAAHYLAMPPVAAMQPAIAHWQDGHLRLRAPLAANVNDKGCAFGGSLCSLMTLAAWGLVYLELALMEALRRQGRASIRRQARTLLADGGVAATFVGRYVAIARG